MLKIQRFQMDTDCQKLSLQCVSEPERLERKELPYVKEKNHLEISEHGAR